jgi:methyl halide transferase
MNTLQCCVVVCNTPLDKTYWNNQYQAHTTGWDLGEVSPAIKNYINTLNDKDIRILIPGCGNCYEAIYLLEHGFTNITLIDIAPALVEKLKIKFNENNNINIVLGDFFEHQGEYDLIIEQTFFCALPPQMRQKYVSKMYHLLAKEGKIKEAFAFLKMEVCQNSVTPRAGSELWIQLQKNSDVVVTLHPFEGITCSGCRNTVSEKFAAIEGVLNVNMSSNFAEILIVSAKEIALETLQKEINYDSKYKIKNSNF